MAGLLCNGYVNQDRVDKTFTTGLYGHGDKVFEGGSYGVLFVLRVSTYQYTVQLDMNGVGMYWRLHVGDSWSDWTKL